MRSSPSRPTTCLCQSSCVPVQQSRASVGASSGRGAAHAGRHRRRRGSRAAAASLAARRSRLWRPYAGRQPGGAGRGRPRSPAREGAGFAAVGSSSPSPGSCPSRSMARVASQAADDQKCQQEERERETRSPWSARQRGAAAGGLPPALMPAAAGRPESSPGGGSRRFAAGPDWATTARRWSAQAITTSRPRAISATMMYANALASPRRPSARAEGPHGRRRKSARTRARGDGLDGDRRVRRQVDGHCAQVFRARPVRSSSSLARPGPGPRSYRRPASRLTRAPRVPGRRPARR